MPQRCVVYGCSNNPDANKGIALHKIPFLDDERPLAKQRRKQWVQFVKKKRAKWEPTQNSRVCSAHFKPEDFVRRFSALPGQSLVYFPRLVSDEIGIAAVPSIQSTDVEGQQSLTRRDRRSILKEMEGLVESSPATSHEQYDADGEDEGADPDPQQMSSVAVEEDSKQVKDVCTQTPGECTGCKKLQSTIRQTTNRVITLKGNIREKDFLIKKLRSELHEASTKTESLGQPAKAQLEDEEDEGEEEKEDKEDDDFTVTEEEPLLSNLSCSEGFMMDSQTETETESDEEQAKAQKNKRIVGENLRTEPKYIVFLSKLLMLFNICPVCKGDKPLVETKEFGTMVEVKVSCGNPDCTQRETTWTSQPNMTGTRMPAANFLLCFSILLSGCSASKVLQMFRNMGLSCISLRKYFKHQGEKIFPAIYLHWKAYQQKILSKLKEEEEPLVIAGDCRHDSMGHYAKYGTYTIFCCTISSIIHFSLIQRNVAGNSPAMEYLGFKECMAYLIGYGLVISTLITDRHTSIAKHMREQLSDITHYFDLWHIKKKIHKVLTKLSKETGCDKLIEWIAPCTNHFLWSATSTISGNGKVILAKFKSFLSHVINKHKDLDDPLFDKCSHGEIQPRRWLNEDSQAYIKMKAALTKKSLENGISQASPLDQTSCLEGFHSVVNQFCPKMTAYSYPGMLCRHIVAALHFNYNLSRETKKNDDGTEQLKVIYPKFKNGEATVRSVRVEPNFDYVEDIYQTYMWAQRQDRLKEAVLELVDLTPAPMNTVFEKQPKEQAIEKRNLRKNMVVQDVPPTAPVSEPPTSHRSMQHCSKDGTSKASL